MQNSVLPSNLLEASIKAPIPLRLIGIPVERSTEHEGSSETERVREDEYEVDESDHMFQAL